MPHKTAYPHGTLFNYNQTKDLEASFVFPLFSLKFLSKRTTYRFGIQRPK